MTTKEFATIVAILKSNYDNLKITDQAQFNFWYEMLKDIDIKVMQTGIKKYIAQSKFKPTIADIRESCMGVVNQGDQMTSAESWKEVNTAIKRFGMYRVTEALESLSPLTQKVARCMDFKELCVSENQMADRAHFMKMFDNYQVRDKKENVLSIGIKEEQKQIRESVGMLSEKFSILE